MNKSQEIREVFEKLGFDISAKKVQEELSKKKIVASANLIGAVKSSIRGVIRPRANLTRELTIKDVRFAKEFVDKIGSFSMAQKALDTFKEFSSKMPGIEP